MSDALRVACFANGLFPPLDVEDDKIEAWLQGLCDALVDESARKDAQQHLDAAVAASRKAETVRAVTHVALFRRALDLGGKGSP